jgi:hypothetical protein
MRAFSAGDMSLSMMFDTNSSRSTDQREHTRRKCHTDSTSCALSHPGHSHLRSATATPLHGPSPPQGTKCPCAGASAPDLLASQGALGTPGAAARTSGRARTIAALALSHTPHAIGLSAVDELFRGAPAHVACVGAVIAREAHREPRRPVHRLQDLFHSRNKRVHRRPTRQRLARIHKL